MIDPQSEVDDTEAREAAIDSLIDSLDSSWAGRRPLEEIRDIARRIASMADGGPLDPG